MEPATIGLEEAEIPSSRLLEEAWKELSFLPILA
jgi:hypothetical protein